MRIVLVIARFNIGGTSRYIFELVKNLSSMGYEFLILVGNVQDGEAEDPALMDLPFRRISKLGRRISLFDDISARREIRQHIKVFNPDIVYSHTFKAGLLCRIGKVSGVNIHAFHGHLFNDPEFLGIKKYFIIFIERLLARKSSRIVVVGKKVSRELLERKIGTFNQHIVIPPGVDPLNLRSKSEARQLLGLVAEERPIVVWMARVTAVKDPAKFIELARHLPEAKFLLVGKGDLFISLKSDLPENLSMLGWQSPSLIWAIADICISTSLNEGMPIALIEAQLAGVPVIALDAGSVSEVIVNNLTGYVIPVFNSEFISKVKELIHDAKLRLSQSQSAESNAKMNFSVDKMVKLHDKLFKELQPPFSK